jgi:hypothetical protein
MHLKQILIIPYIIKVNVIRANLNIRKGRYSNMGFFLIDNYFVICGFSFVGSILYKQIRRLLFSNTTHPLSIKDLIILTYGSLGWPMTVGLYLGRKKMQVFIENKEKDYIE